MMFSQCFRSDVTLTEM